MLKIGQNWGKMVNYPPNARQRYAPLGPRITQETLIRIRLNLNVIFTIQCVPQYRRS